MKARSIQDVINENGYVNRMICRNCAENIGYLDEDIEWQQRKNPRNMEWEFYGYITCPSCGTQTAVRIDRADIFSRYNVAKYDTTYRNKKSFK